MSFLSTKDFVDKTVGGNWATHWQKTTGAAAYTAGRYYDLTMLQGNPRANVYAGGQCALNQLDSSLKTSLWHCRNVSPATKHVITHGAYSAVATANPSVLTLCDFLGFYPLIDLDDDTLQPMDNTLSIQRYADGKGVKAFIVATADTAAGAANIILEYTNDKGETGRISPSTISVTPSAVIGQIVHSGNIAGNVAPFLPLAPGDTGIRKVDSIQMSVGTGGGFGCLVLVKPLATVCMVAAGVATERDMVSQLPSLPRVLDGAYLGHILHTGGALAAGSMLRGYVEFGWG